MARRAKPPFLMLPACVLWTPGATPFTPPGVTRNSEKRIVLLIVNLQFSKLSENGVGDLFVHLHFSDSVYWPNQDTQRSKSLPKLTTSHSQNVKIGETKFEKLETCLEIGKS